jgi:hypothetical protein
VGRGWVAVAGVAVDVAGCGGHFDMRMVLIGQVLTEI